LKNFINDIACQVNNYGDLLVKSLEKTQGENKEIMNSNKILLEEYSNSQTELSKKEKEYLEIKSKLHNLIDQMEVNNTNNQTNQNQNSQRANKSKSGISIDSLISSKLKENYKKSYNEFEEKVKSTTNFDLKSNQEDIVILLEAIKLIQTQRKLDLSSELDKNQLDFLNKISAEYSLHDEEDELIAEKIIEQIEKDVNNCHQSGKIREVEISQITNTEYKFDGVRAEFILDNDKLRVKNDDNIGFEEWLIKNFAIKKGKINQESNSKSISNAEIRNDTSSSQVNNTSKSGTNNNKSKTATKKK
jgi:hypothetical protein